MVESFSVENYLSFKDKATISFVPETLKESPDSLHAALSYDMNFKLLKSIGIYGHNSFGKSNFLKAYQFFQTLILCSNDPGHSELIDVDNFRLNAACAHEPSFFEARFLLGSTRYRYGFKVTRDRIVAEWLYYAEARVKENFLFVRAEQETKVNKNWQKKNGEIIDRSIHYAQKHQLLLSSLLNAKLTVDPVGIIGEWFKGNAIMIDISDEKHFKRALTILSVERYRPMIQRLIEQADLGFISIQSKIDSMAMNKLGVDEGILKMWYHAELKEFSLYTRHHFYDITHKRIDSVYFDFLKNESAGSLRFLILACYLVYVIHQGQLILIDEIDSKFHSDLLQLIVQFYNDPAINTSGSQMLFTTHNTVLLNESLRRDQIQVVEKNEFGESAIRRAHSAQTPIRLDTPIEKQYRKGKLGGVSKKLRDDGSQTKLDF